jgi:hypothetical protein
MSNLPAGRQVPNVPRIRHMIDFGIFWGALKQAVDDGRGLVRLGMKKTP